jgi:cytochrome c553
MKKSLVSIGILVGFIISLLMMSGALAQQKAKDNYAMDNTYGQVKFNHKKHAETLKVACEKCHHELKGKKPGEVPKSCGTCHKAAAEGKTLSAKDAFHKDCQECHKQDKAKKAPTTCIKCHDTKVKKK